VTVPPDDRAREDELFRQIVAGYTDEASDPVPRWPVEEDADSDADTDAPSQTSDASQSGPGPQPEAGLPAWVEPAALPDEGHYEPPVPPRLPRPRLRTATGLLVLLLGLVSLLVPFRVGLDDSPGSLLLAMLVTGTGAWLLVTSLRDSHDDDPDDGAVV
jgi:hypothetical protein